MNKLREPHFQQLFRETAQKYQLEVSSIAMSGFYGQSFLERANYKELVQDCLHAMRVMNTKVTFAWGIGCPVCPSSVTT